MAHWYLMLRYSPVPQHWPPPGKSLWETFNYWAEEGEGFEESPLFFQLECTNLHEKLNAVINGYNRKLSSKTA